MAEIIESGGGDKHGKKRPKKGAVRMDMTPMVDLAFLLLTFFILATSLSKPKTLEIIYPKEVENKDDKTKLADELATTLIIGEEENQIFYYTLILQIQYHIQAPATKFMIYQIITIKVNLMEILVCQIIMEER